jgi:hypothetical protein
METYLNYLQMKNEWKTLFKKYNKAYKQRELLIFNIENAHDMREIAIENKNEPCYNVFHNKIIVMQRMKNLHDSYLENTIGKMNDLNDQMNKIRS